MKKVNATVIVTICLSISILSTVIAAPVDYNTGDKDIPPIEEYGFNMSRSDVWDKLGLPYEEEESVDIYYYVEYQGLDGHLAFYYNNERIDGVVWESAYENLSENQYEEFVATVVEYYDERIGTEDSSKFINYEKTVKDYYAWIDVFNNTGYVLYIYEDENGKVKFKISFGRISDYVLQETDENKQEEKLDSDNSFIHSSTESGIKVDTGIIQTICPDGWLYIQQRDVFGQVDENGEYPLDPTQMCFSKGAATEMDVFSKLSVYVYYRNEPYSQQVYDTNAMWYSETEPITTTINGIECQGFHAKDADIFNEDQYYEYDFIFMPVDNGHHFQFRLMNSAPGNMDTISRDDPDVQLIMNNLVVDKIASSGIEILEKDNADLVEDGEPSITVGKWLEIQDSSTGEKIYFSTGSIIPKEDCLLFTDISTRVVRDGTVKLMYVDSQNQNGTPIFNVKGTIKIIPVKGSGLQIKEGELHVDKYEYESLGKTSFSLSQEYMVEDGGNYLFYFDVIDAYGEVLNSDNCFLVIDGQGTCEPHSILKPSSYSGRFSIDITGVVPLSDKADDYVLSDCTYTPDIVEMAGGARTYLSGKQEYVGPDNDNGILIVKIIRSGAEDYSVSYVIDGKGITSTYDSADDFDPDSEYEFEPYSFTPIGTVLDTTFTITEENIAKNISFEETCTACQSLEGVTIASDHSYIKFDSNINDDDSSEVYDIMFNFYAEAINDALGLPESLYEKMLMTTDANGVQTETYDNVTVSWTNRVGKGLEVLYENR